MADRADTEPVPITDPLAHARKLLATLQARLASGLSPSVLALPLATALQALTDYEERIAGEERRWARTEGAAAERARWAAVRDQARQWWMSEPRLGHVDATREELACQLGDAIGLLQIAGLLK